MNKKRLLTVFIILLLLVGGWYAYLHLYLPNQSNNNNTELDALINQTTGSSLTSTGATIDVNASSDGTPQYEGGGTYADFSDDAARMALEQWKRVILVFEREGDPTSEALHTDITQREQRIPKNTIIFFVNVDASTSIRDRLSIERPNTIIFIGSDWQEIRRKGNGIVSLSQIVKSIDGLFTK